MTIRVCVIFLLTAGTLFASVLEEQFYNYAAVLIHAGPSIGSGFYLRTPTNAFLVTAKHVLFDLATTNAEPPLYSTDAEVESSLWETNVTAKLHLPLAQFFASGSLKYSKSNDVAVVLFAIRDSPTNLFSLLPGSLLDIPTNIQNAVVFTPPEETALMAEVSPGAEVYVSGFPISLAALKQFEPNKPLLRRGIVSGKNSQLQTLIIDCPVYKGNSGGPVRMCSHDDLVTRVATIGITTQFIPCETVGINGSAGPSLYNSGYTVVEPMDHVYRLIGYTPAK